MGPAEMDRTRRQRPRGNICLYVFFLYNQNHILVDGTGAVSKNVNFESIFETNVKRIGHVVAILDTWHKPPYLKKIWTIFEQLTAMNNEAPVTIVMPPSAAAALIEEFKRGEVGILR